MTLVVTANVVGQTRGEAVRLPNRRRRLSTLVARHKPQDGRRFIVSVHRRSDELYRPSDRTVRLRAAWSKTLVGPEDVVLITTVPLGKGVLSIGLAIASIALIALAPYAAPAIAGAAVFGSGVAAGSLTFAIQAGMVIGGLALGYAAQAATASKKKAANDIYSLSGGGNVPKPNARRPLLYGRRWSAPPLSQKDFITYDGDAMVLVKRMTLGIGKFQIHRIRVGDALFWNEGSGIQAPFNAVAGNLGAAVEYLYGTPSTITPGDVITSNDVGGQELPRPGGNPARTPWFRLAPQGVTVDAAQMSWTYPAIYRVSSAGRQSPTVAGVVFFGREIDPVTGTVIGAEFEMFRSSEGSTALTTSPLRRSGYFRLPHSGAYEVSAQNMYPDPVGFVQENRASWDQMVAFEDDTRVRPETTEIVMRVRAGKGLTVTAFSDVMVDATRIVPVWTGSAWVEQPTQKAVWAFCDLVRATYGLALPDGVDATKAKYYADLLTANDTYDGQLPEVASFWEAAGEVLHPLRADPVKVGPVHSFVRDESRAEPRHVLTRRQIVRDSGAATFKTQVAGSDVIVEFERDGDPKRPDEVRYSYGPPTRTPKRYKIAGISDGLHALKHATWLAAVAVFRGAERKVTTEWDGRLIYPGDHILSDLWFLNHQQVFGVAARSGNLLTLDTDANLPTAYGYGSIRTRAGREWGILRMRGSGPRGLELHPDDVTALQSQTGMALSDVLARDTQDPTTVVVGDLVELQETYVARSAVPSDADNVQIEMVADDARVWQLLDETVIAPAPVGTDSLEEPLVPQISVLHARCSRIETGIEVVWGVSTTRGARNYEADLSYDNGATWEVLSPFGPASSGRAQMRQVDTPVSVRARAYGRTGLPGDYVVATFTTVKPVIDGQNIEFENMPLVDREALSDDIQGILFGDASTPGSIAEARARADAAAQEVFGETARALSPDPAIRGTILNPALTSLREDLDIALQAAGGLAVNLNGLMASLYEAGLELNSVEGKARIYAVSVQAKQLKDVSLTLDAQAAAITARATQVDLDDTNLKLTSATQRIDAAQGTISSEVLAGSVARIDQDMLLGTLDTLLGAAEARTADFAQNMAYAGQTIGARLDDAGRNIASYGIQLSSYKGNVSAQFLEVSRTIAAGDYALSQSISVLSAAVNDPATGLAKTRSELVDEKQARADGDSAEASARQALAVLVGNNAAAIDTEQKSRADGDSANASSITNLGAEVGSRFAGGRITFRANAAPGGVSARYAIELVSSDGLSTQGTGFYIDLNTDGSSAITLDARRVRFGNAGTGVFPFFYDDATGTLTVASLRVTTSAIVPGSVSQSDFGATSSTSLDFTITTRPNSRVSIMLEFDGQPTIQLPLNAAGRLQILRDGVIIRDKPVGFYLFRDTNGNNFGPTLPTTAIVVDRPAAGQHTYTVRNTGNQGPLAYKWEELAV